MKRLNQLPIPVYQEWEVSQDKPNKTVHNNTYLYIGVTLLLWLWAPDCAHAMEPNINPELVIIQVELPEENRLRVLSETIERQEPTLEDQRLYGCSWIMIYALFWGPAIYKTIYALT